MSEIYEKILDRDKDKDNEDEWIWNDEKTQMYMVKLVYKRLNCSIRDKEGLIYDLFWKTKVLPITQHFQRCLIINKVATRDIL